MKKYIIRLDDACEKMDRDKWNSVETVLDKHNVKPLVGIIPACKDPKMNIYETDPDFWETTVVRWQNKGWEIALHGYDHVYITQSGGCNPINKKSEFASLPIDEQKRKIKEGIRIFNEHGISPKVFFAPSHTFDENTLKAIKEESDIRFISDTIAFDAYAEKGLTFIPQQGNYMRKMPYRITTFCLHPNTMNLEQIKDLDMFIGAERRYFERFPTEESNREFGLIDKVVKLIYYKRRHL